MLLPKLFRQTLADKAAISLLEYIERNNLRPGDVLPSEAVLADSFGVSRPVIRETLKALAGSQIVEIVNGKGAVIKPITSDPLRGYFQKALQFEYSTVIELLEVRKGLEVQSARLAAERRSDEELAKIEQAVTGMRVTMQNPEQCIAYDLEFHLAIASATHNSMLYYLLESIRDATKNTILEGRRSRRTDDELERVQVLHDMIYRTIAEGDVVGAGQWMEAHFDDAVLSMARKLSGQ